MGFGFRSFRCCCFDCARLKTFPSYSFPSLAFHSAVACPWSLCVLIQLKCGDKHEHPRSGGRAQRGGRRVGAECFPPDFNLVKCIGKVTAAVHLPRRRGVAFSLTSIVCFARVLLCSSLCWLRTRSILRSGSVARVCSLRLRFLKVSFSDCLFFLFVDVSRPGVLRLGPSRPLSAVRPASLAGFRVPSLQAGSSR